MIEEEQMAGLLAPQARPQLRHLLQHVPVAHLGLDGADALRPQGLVEAEIGHHGGDDHVALETPARAEMAAADGESIVAVAHLTRFVHRDEPVAVAVEGQAQIRLGGEHAAGEPLRMERPRVPIDIEAIGSRREHHHPRSEGAEEARRYPIGRAVRAVERDGETSQVKREGLAHLGDVIGLGPVVVDEASHRGPRGLGRTVRTGQSRLDLVFPRIGKLGPFGGKDLDAVVLEGIVGGGEHHAALGFQASREIGDAGRGQHAGGEDIGARGEGAGHEGAFDHGAGQARIAPDDEAHLGEAVVLEEGGHELAPEAKGQLRGERHLVGQAADAVRAEQAPHQRSLVRPTRTTAGVMRSTLTPGGTRIWSGPRPTTSSPGLAPARFTLTRRASGDTRDKANRSP